MVAPLNITDQVGDMLLQQAVIVAPGLRSLSAWAFFVLMLVAAVVLSQLVAFVLRLFAKLVTSRTKTEIDDILIEAVQQPIAWIIFSILVYVAFAPLTLPAYAQIIVQGSLAALNIVLVAWLLHRVVSAIFRIWAMFAEKTDSVLDDTMLPLMSKFAKAAVWILAFLLILSAWGFAIGPFLAGMGIAGLAIGFAVQDSLSNIFGGISLALDNAYKKGDKIKLGDGTVGVVHDITLRSTRINTYDGDLVMVPNGKIANDDIYTYAQPHPKSRGQVNFGVEYGSDPAKVKKVVLEVLKKIEKIEKDPEPSVLFMNMGDSSLNFRAYFWLADYSDVFATEREATEAIYNVLNKSKIGIPFPTRTIYMKKA